MTNRYAQNRRKQVYVHTLQRSYAIGLGLLLFGYSLFVFGLAFLFPYAIPAIKLLFSQPLEEQADAATQMLLQVQNVWPALLETASNVWPVLLTLIVAAAVLSIYLTHRIAGPMYRLQLCANEFAQGNLSQRFRLREGDHMREFADLTSHAIENIEQAMIEIRAHSADSLDALHELLDEMKGSAVPDRAKLEEFRSAMAQRQQRIEEVLGRFHFSGSPPKPTQEAPRPEEEKTTTEVSDAVPHS